MKRHKSVLLFAVICFLLTNFLPQPSQAQKKITVAFYNTENMFDTIDDPHKNDNDLSAGRQLQWDSKNILKKLKTSARRSVRSIRIGKIADAHRFVGSGKRNGV